MKLDAKFARTLVTSLCVVTLTACSYNPFISNNHTTGSAAGVAIGAGAGAGSIALLGGSKTMMLLGGIGGGAIGYYMTSLRYDASGFIQAGGDVYILGDYMGIYLPTDQVFQPNTADFTPQAPGILNSVLAVLQRKPDNNIIISGNTSGFDRPGREQALSEKRAKAVAAYLWSGGIMMFKDKSDDTRKLNYTGHGDFFPIAKNDTNAQIRKNSRIQITSYPCLDDLRESGKKINMDTIASLNDETPTGEKNACGHDQAEC